MAHVKIKTMKLYQYQRMFVCWYWLCAILLHLGSIEGSNSFANNDYDKFMSISNDAKRQISTDEDFPVAFSNADVMKDIKIQPYKPPSDQNRTQYYKTKNSNEDSPVKDKVSVVHKIVSYPEVAPSSKLGQGRFDLPDENYKPEYESYTTHGGLGLSAGGAAMGGIAYCKWCRKKHSGSDDNTSLTTENEESQDDTALLIPECEEEHEMNSSIDENEESQDDTVILIP